MKIKVQDLINKIDEKNRYYVLIGILFFIFLLDYFLLMRPQLVTLTKINPEIKMLLQDIQKTQEDSQKLGSYQSEIKRLESALAETNSKVRSKNEVPVVLEQISRMANQSQIKIDQITPAHEDQSVLLEDNKRIYYALPILLEARSGYHDSGRFLNLLEQSNLFLNVTSFSIAAGKEDLRDHALKMNLQAIVFEDKQ